MRLGRCQLCDTTWKATAHHLNFTVPNNVSLPLCFFFKSFLVPNRSFMMTPVREKCLALYMWETPSYLSGKGDTTSPAPEHSAYLLPTPRALLFAAFRLRLCLIRIMTPARGRRKKSSKSLPPIRRSRAFFVCSSPSRSFANPFAYVTPEHLRYANRWRYSEFQNIR